MTWLAWRHVQGDRPHTWHSTIQGNISRAHGSTVRNCTIESPVQYSSEVRENCPATHQYLVMHTENHLHKPLTKERYIPYNLSAQSLPRYR